MLTIETSYKGAMKSNKEATGQKKEFLNKRI